MTNDELRETIWLSGNVLGNRLDSPGSMPGSEGVEIFLHLIVSTLAARYTQPSLKLIPELSRLVKFAE